MWRMEDGDRVLTEPEWEIFKTGLDHLRNSIESDISGQVDETDTGVPVFDRLTAEQKLALLADVAAALYEPSIPMPDHTAANEAAIVAVFQAFKNMLEAEIEFGEPDQSDLRTCLLTAVTGPGDWPGRLPSPSSTKWERWDDLCESILHRILWDHDYDMEDAFLDLPPEEARIQLELAGIDPDYYLEITDEPDRKRLIKVCQTLARLVGLAVPVDNGGYAALMDRYHDLFVGPVFADEIASWEANPWIEVVWFTEPGWDCLYLNWQAELSGEIPTAPFHLDPPDVMGQTELPEGYRVERFHEKWVIRNAQGFYWEDLVGNGWSDTPDVESSDVAFSTELEAKSAFIRAQVMYDEREQRHKAAKKRLGISD